MVQKSTPAAVDSAIVRSKGIRRLLDQVVVGAVITRISDPVETAPFRHFTLYLRIKSTGTGAHVLRAVLEWLEPASGLWHAYNQDLFASLYYEDTATATEVDDVFSGDCVGREMRVRLVGTSTTSSLYFTVSAAVEFYN